MSSPPPQSPKVRNIISIFESQTIPVRNEQSALVKRTKSMHNLTSIKPTVNGDELDKSQSVEPPQLVHVHKLVLQLQTSLSKYEVYNKDDHIHYQELIFFLLSDIVAVDCGDNSDIVRQKNHYLSVIKEFNKFLNSQLPQIDSVQPQSVAKLKHVFEVKPSQGLEEIANIDKNGKDYFKYVPFYKRLNSSKGDDGNKLVIDDIDSVKEKGVVHNASIQRQVDNSDRAQMVSVNKLKSMFDSAKQREPKVEPVKHRESKVESVKQKESKVKTVKQKESKVQTVKRTESIVETVDLAEAPKLTLPSVSVQRTEAHQVQIIEEPDNVPVSVDKLKNLFERSTARTATFDRILESKKDLRQDIQQEIELERSVSQETTEVDSNIVEDNDSDEALAPVSVGKLKSLFESNKDQGKLNSHLLVKSYSFGNTSRPVRKYSQSDEETSSSTTTVVTPGDLEEEASHRRASVNQLKDLFETSSPPSLGTRLSVDDTEDLSSIRSRINLFEESPPSDFVSMDRPEDDGDDEFEEESSDDNRGFYQVNPDTDSDGTLKEEDEFEDNNNSAVYTIPSVTISEENRNGRRSSTSSISSGSSSSSTSI